MKVTIPDDGELLAVFNDGNRRPLHVSEVAERLGLSLTARRPLSEALDAIASRGLLEMMPGSRYRLSRKSTTEVRGRFTQNPRGFGFVAAEDGGADVYIPATSVRGAMHGDRVSVGTLEKDGRREGVVLSVLERRPPRVPGTLRIRPAGAWVEPDDLRIRGPIPVDEIGTAKDGEAVVCELLRFPEMAGELPVGRVRASLGRPGNLDVEVLKVLLREGVEEDFPQEALDEAKALPAALRPDDYLGREDLRGLPLVTIDPDDARDHDDAVYVRREEDGTYKAWIAVADVSHYVRPGTAIDLSATQRGTSIYLPDRAIPMLPRELSSNLASLLEGQDRLVLAVEVELEADGKPKHTRLIEGVMNSRARLTYSNLAYVMGWGDLGKPSEAAEKLRGDLIVAAELAMLLNVRRMRRGALALDLPEARVRFAEDGRTPIDIVQSRQDPGLKKAYNVIEELMLLANECVAELCRKKSLPAVYRVHGAPEEDGLVKLCTAAKVFGFDLEPEEAVEPKKLAKFVRKVAEHPHSRVLHMLLLRSLPQAFYSVGNDGHFGLASEAYLHFTSPIRRYPDVLVHRAVRAYLRGEKPKKDDEALEQLRRNAAESSRLERRAMEVEREAMDLHRCVVAQAHIGELHTATVSGLTNGGPFVQTQSPFLDVLVRVDEQGSEWDIDELGLYMADGRTGLHFALGDEVVIEIKESSLSRRTVYGSLPEEELARGRRGKKNRKNSKEKHGGKGRSRR